MRIGRITSITVQHDRDPNNEQKLGTYSVVLEGEGFIETPAECCHRLKAESVARAILGSVRALSLIPHRSLELTSCARN